MGHMRTIAGALAAGWLAASCASDPPDAATETPESANAVAEATTPAASGPPAAPILETPDPTSARSNRKIREGCDPVLEAARHEEFAGEPVFITFAWQDMGPHAAELATPAMVLSIEEAWVLVRFDRRIPNLQLFTSVWTTSGHIAPRPDGSYGVDPCSATFEKGGW